MGGPDLSDVIWAGGLGSEIVEQWKRRWLQNVGTTCCGLGWFSGFSVDSRAPRKMFPLKLFFDQCHSPSRRVVQSAGGVNHTLTANRLLLTPTAAPIDPFIVHKQSTPGGDVSTLRSGSVTAAQQRSWLCQFRVSSLLPRRLNTSILALTRRRVCTGPASQLTKWNALESSACFLVGSPPSS